MPKTATVSFIAYGDDGRAYRVLVETRSITTPVQAGGNGETIALQEFRTASGQAVARLDRGIYQLLPAGVLLYSSDPGAP